MKTYNAGDFRHKLDVLSLKKVTRNRYQWETSGTIWSCVEKQSAGSIYSRYGVTERSVKLVIRAFEGLTLHNAVRLHDGGHLFLTDIDREIPGYYVLSAAVKEPVTCKAERTGTVMGADNRPVFKKRLALTFPGYLAEKYLKQAQEEPMSYSETRYILITPKAIDIQTGTLVNIAGSKYESVIPHTLDPYKNEYEIVRRFDN